MIKNIKFSAKFEENEITLSMAECEEEMFCQIMDNILHKVLVKNADKTNSTNEIKKYQHEIKKSKINKNINKIKIPNASNGYRCPSCKQAIFIQGEDKNFGIRILNNENMPIKSYQLNVENIIVNKTDNNEIDKQHLIQTYKSALNYVDKDKLYMLIDSDDYIATCPVCGEKHTYSEWINAYSVDLDNSNLCDVCGEEKKIIVTENGNKIQCENNCLDNIFKTSE